MVEAARRVCNYRDMGERHTRFRYRTVVMDDFDDAMLSLALADAYPGVRFVEGGGAQKEPRLSTCRTIPECRSSRVDVYFVPPGWTPEFEPDESPWGRFYLLSNGPDFRLHYIRGDWFWGKPGGGNWAFSLPTPESGQLAMGFDRNSPEERKFVRDLWKLFDRLMTNAVKGGHWDGYVSVKDCKGGEVWVGAHVMDWCRRDSTRMLDGNRRPCDDWEWPDDEWHRDLRRRVIEIHGPDFGAPPEPCVRRAVY